MIDAKERIHAYTYGVSERQSESLEVVYAKKLCEILGIDWQQIELGKYNTLIDEWCDIYGISTHAHGMYQMEFYDKIRKLESSELCRVASGLFGDVWSGNWRFLAVTESCQLQSLAKNYGLSVDSDFCILQERHELRDAFYENNRIRLKDENWRIITAARMKIILISYTLRIPEYYGFEAWSPFLDFEGVSKIINLDWTEKEHRKWQVEYFKKNNVLVGELKLPCDHTNCLDKIACLYHTPKPLDTKLLGQIVKEEYVEKINQNLLYMNFDKLKYYYAYLVLYPLQKILCLKEKGMSKKKEL